MNKYDVLSVVGEGAYGVVLKCKNKDTHEVVAIKKFKESEEDEVVRKTTLREVKILRLVRHENVVQLQEAFRRKGKLYLVFEYVERSMLDLLEEHPNGVHTDKVRVLMFQLMRAVEFCHRHDVIHRDIKPENLLINPADMALRLCDFGFARTVTPEAQLTDYVATRWYRAPELLLGATQYGKDVDIWAFGCIMGELTDGQPLFAGENEVDQLYVIQKVMGPLTREHMEMFLRNPRFLGIQFKDVSRPETLQKRYVTRMQKPQMHLMQGALQMEPRKRLAAIQALDVPWFEGVELPRSLRPPAGKERAVSSSATASFAPPAPHPPRNGTAGASEEETHHAPPRDEPRAPLRSSSQRDHQHHAPHPPPPPPPQQQQQQPGHLREFPPQRDHLEDLRQRSDLRGGDLHLVDVSRPNTRGENPRGGGGEEHQFGVLAHAAAFSPAQPQHQTSRPFYLLPWEAAVQEESRPHHPDRQQTLLETGAMAGPVWDVDEKGGGEGRRQKRRPGTGELVSGDRPVPLAGACGPDQRGVAAAARHNPSAGTGGSEEWPFAPSRVPPWRRDSEGEDDPPPAFFGAPGGGGGALPGPAPPLSHGRRAASRQQQQAGVLSNPPAAAPARRSPSEVPLEAGPDLQIGLGGLPSLHSGMFLAHQGAPPSQHHQGALLGEGSRQRDRGALDSSRAREEDLRRQYLGIDGGAGRWGGDWQGLGLPAASGGLGQGHGPAELGPVRDARGSLLHDVAARDQRQPEGRAGGFVGPLGRREPSSYHGH